jgi:putative transposase
MVATESRRWPEVSCAVARPRYGRAKNDDACSAGVIGHRHGSRTRSLTGSFGKTEITVPRARLRTCDGGTAEWHSKALRAYQRRTLTADALIAGAYLAGTNTRRVRRALAALFRGAVSEDIMSRVWCKIKSDWDAWNARSLALEPIVRLILDGTVVRVRLDRKATSISLLVVMGVREDGQKVLLAIKNMGGESAEAWRAVLDDLIERGLRRPAFLIVDGAPGLEKAITDLQPFWQRVRARAGLKDAQGVACLSGPRAAPHGERRRADVGAHRPPAASGRSDASRRDGVTAAILDR